MGVLQQLKKAHPNGRFWLKLDGTDLKTCLQESLDGQWNGDVDLGDGLLESLRDAYIARMDDTSHYALENLHKILKDLNDDINYLSDKHKKAVDLYITSQN